VENANIFREDLDWSKRQRTASASDGSYVLRGLPSGEVLLEAMHHRYLTASTRIVVSPGAPVVWDPVLDAGGRIEGVVVDQHSGAPVPAWWVVARRDQTAKARTLTDAQGRFLLGGLTPGPWRISVMRPGAPLSEAAFAPDVMPGGDPLLLVVDTTERPSAGLRGRVVHPDGESLDGRWVELQRLDQADRPAIEPLTDSGAFEFESLMPGRYRLDARVPGFSTPDLGDITLAAGSVLDLGPIVLGAGGTVLVFVEFLSGTPVEDLHLWMSSAGFGGAGLEPLGGPTLQRSGPLASGAWEVRVSGDGIAHNRWPCEVESGQETEVRIAVGPGVLLKVDLAWNDGERLRMDSACTVFSDSGEVAASREFSHQVMASATYRVWLRAGHYRVEVTRPELPTIVRNIDLAESEGVELSFDMHAEDG
jgi:hypothetical protein